MRKGNPENLTLTCLIEGKRDREKQRVTYLKRLCKWMAEETLGRIQRGQTELRVTKNKKLWRAYALNGHRT